MFAKILRKSKDKYLINNYKYKYVWVAATSKISADEFCEVLKAMVGGIG